MDRKNREMSKGEKSDRLFERTAERDERHKFRTKQKEGKKCDSDSKSTLIVNWKDFNYLFCCENVSF